MNELHLFAGAGGGILGGMLLGHTPVCAVEIESYQRAILLQRQRDGILPAFPIWDDVTTFDGRPWKGLVDVVCGGFPCQDISSAGGGKGLSGERSGLWAEFARIIGEVRPRYVFVENSPMLSSRGLDCVLGDLSCLGFNAEWGTVSAHQVGGLINRDRIWIVACSAQESCGVIHRGPHKKYRNMGNDLPAGSFIDRFMEELERQGGKRQDQRQGDLPPYLFRVATSVAPELDELRSIGNGQVPAVAATAFTILAQRLMDHP